MKKISVLGFILMALLLFMSSCTSEDGLIEFNQKTIDDIATCGDVKTVALVAGQHIEVGTVSVANDETNLYVNYTTTGDWFLTDTHLYVGHENNIPYNNAGNPNFGHFPYKESHSNVQSYTYIIPMADLDDCLSVVTHAEVDRIVDGSSVQNETAFGCGDKEFPGSRWGCYFDYCIQDCEPETCIEVLGYHDACGVCENGALQTFLAYVFIEAHGANGFDVEILKDIDGCDISSSTQVGTVNISLISTTELQIVYTVDAGYELCDIDFNYGKSSTDLGTNYSMSFDAPTSSHSFVIPRSAFGANIYFTAGAQISM